MLLEDGQVELLILWDGPYKPSLELQSRAPEDLIHLFLSCKKKNTT